MKKEWKKPTIEIITKDELEDLIVAAGCSRYHDFCEAGYYG